jgi:hypothetical protein
MVTGSPARRCHGDLQSGVRSTYFNSESTPIPKISASDPVVWHRASVTWDTDEIIDYRHETVAYLCRRQQTPQLPQLDKHGIIGAESVWTVGLHPDGHILRFGSEPNRDRPFEQWAG